MVKEDSNEADLPRGFVAQDRRSFLNMVVRGLGLAAIGAPCAMGQSLLLRPASRANAFDIETRSISESFTETRSFSEASFTYTFTKDTPEGEEGTYSFTYSYPPHTEEHRGWWVATYPGPQTVTVYETSTISYAGSWSYSHSVSYVGSSHTGTALSKSYSRLETHYRTMTYTVDTGDPEPVVGSLRGEHDGCVYGPVASLDATIDLADRRSRRGRALHPILRRLA